MEGHQQQQASTSRREISTRERIMKMRADGMRWEALLCAAKKGSQHRAEELLNKALMADEGAARLQGEEAVSRAKRRAARLTEAFQRCFIFVLRPVALCICPSHTHDPREQKLYADDAHPYLNRSMMDDWMGS